MIIAILANGLLPTKAEVLAYLNTAEMVVCCDGALKNYLLWLHRQSTLPHHRLAVVGDGDSLSPALLQEAADSGIVLEHHRIPEQESNDLSKAVRFAMAAVQDANATANAAPIPQGQCCELRPVTSKPTNDGSRHDCHGDTLQVNILGATGLREDHTLGNISLLAHYMERYPNVEFVMRSDFNTFYPMQGTRQFASEKGQQVSLFSLTPEVPVSVSGLRYPIESRCLRSWWEGTLNEALGDTFEVIGGTMIVAVELRVKS